MNLYTIIVDYKGGTYVSQYKALNIQDVKRIWINKELPKLTEIAKFDSSEVKLIEVRLIEEKEINFDGLTNVWNNDLGFLSEDYFSFIIVSTVHM